MTHADPEWIPSEQMHAAADRALQWDDGIEVPVAMSSQLLDQFMQRQAAAEVASAWGHSADFGEIYDAVGPISDDDQDMAGEEYKPCYEVACPPLVDIQMAAFPLWPLPPDAQIAQPWVATALARHLDPEILAYYVSGATMLLPGPCERCAETVIR